VAGSVVEHPDSDSDTELTTPTDQQVDLTGIEQLSSWVDADAIWASCLDDENLPGVDVFDGAHEVGERDGDRGKFEGCSGVRAEDGTEEGRQLSRVPLDQRDNIDDASRRNTSGESDWFSRVLVMNIETERRQKVLDDGEVGASAGVEDDVEGVETRTLEPSPCGGERGGGGGIHTDVLWIDAELDGESLDLSCGRDGVKGGPTRRLDDLDGSASNAYNKALSTHAYETERENLRERAS